jgi:hypothetical protein
MPTREEIGTLPPSRLPAGMDGEYIISKTVIRSTEVTPAVKTSRGGRLVINAKGPGIRVTRTFSVGDQDGPVVIEGSVKEMRALGRALVEFADEDPAHE